MRLADFFSMMTSYNRVEAEPFGSAGNHSSTALHERIDTLLRNPEFVLLHVPKDGGMMRLVQPAMDPKIRKNLWIASGGLRCYALSHLWGFSNEEEQNNHLWDVGSFIRDKNGAAIKPIPMRAEKRETLLALLKKRPGYWWIDVLCASATTPFGIMGAIYRYCKVCYAMVDCKPQILYNLSDPKRLNNMKAQYEIVFSEEKDMQATLYKEWVEDWSEELQLLHQLIQCRWFNRVWTWQEATLPFRTYLIPETSGYEAIKYRVLLSSFAWTQSLERLEEPHINRTLPKDTIQKLRTIFSAWCEIYEAMEYKTTTEFSFGPSASKFVDAIAALGASTRTCMNPVDYVYGVLGSLDLNVDRAKDHHTVWMSFLTELDKIIQWVLKHDEDRCWGDERYVASISISEKAYYVDLTAAKNMSDVYSGLLNAIYE